MSGRDYRIALPPKEKGLFRVVYVIDIGADNPLDAAKKTHEIMTAHDSIAPVLEVISQGGKVTKIDLNKHCWRGT